MRNFINGIAGCKAGIGVIRAITEELLFQRWLITFKTLSFQKKKLRIYSVLHINFFQFRVFIIYNKVTETSMLNLNSIVFVYEKTIQSKRDGVDEYTFVF